MSIKKTATATGETRYRVRYLDPNGASREKWFRRKVYATTFERSIKTDIDRGEYRNPRAGNVPFVDVANTWLGTRADKARSTLDRDRSYLNSLILPTFQKRSVKSIRTSDVESWLASLGCAPATRIRAFQILRNVLETARRDDMIRVNPAADVKPPTLAPTRVPRVLTDGDLNAVLQAAEQVDGRTAILIHLMARCGLRVGEAIALRRSNVNLGAGTIEIQRSMSRREGTRPVKGRLREEDGRTITIPNDVVNRLRVHFQQQPVTDLNGLVATAPRGGPIVYNNWRRREWRKIVQAAGVNLTPHDLRRTAATRLMVNDRWSPAEVQAFLGHRDPRTTLAIYTLIEATSLPRPSELTAEIA
jgi:integrase